MYVIRVTGHHTTAIGKARKGKGFRLYFLGGNERVHEKCTFRGERATLNSTSICYSAALVNFTTHWQSIETNSYDAKQFTVCRPC